MCENKDVAVYICITSGVKAALLLAYVKKGRKAIQNTRIVSGSDESETKLRFFISEADRQLRELEDQFTEALAPTGLIGHE